MSPIIEVDNTTQVKIKTLTLEDLQADYDQYMQEFADHEEKKVESSSILKKDISETPQNDQPQAIVKDQHTAIISSTDSFVVISSKTGKDITNHIFLAHIFQNLAQIPTHFTNPHPIQKFMKFKVLKKASGLLESDTLYTYTQIFFLLTSLKKVQESSMKNCEEVVKYLEDLLMNTEYGIKDFIKKLPEIKSLVEVPISI